MTPAELFAAALQHHQAGRLAEAEPLYRRILGIDPDHVEGLHHLGILAQQVGRNDVAIELIGLAALKGGSVASIHNSLGVALKAAGRRDEASAVLRRAIALDPRHADYHSNLCNVLREQGFIDEAVAEGEAAVRLDPDHAAAQRNLGLALREQGRLDEAEQACRRSLALAPNVADAHLNLASVLQARGRFEAAADCCRRAIELNPGSAQAFNDLSSCLKELGRMAEAIQACRQAIDRGPDLALPQQALSTLSAYLSDFSETVPASDRALALTDSQALAAELWEARLYAFSYHPDLPAEAIFGEFVRWGDRFAAPTTDFASHDRTPGRRLKVGYVSPDFRRHTSRFYFMPLLAHHDPAGFEIFAYSNVKTEDASTGAFKAAVDQWRDIRGLSDEAAAQRIREDGIDILVDCCNHMRDARLGVFALKPAPIQVTWLGAAWTTGLKAIDYVLFDPYIAPEGTLAREEIVRLPDCFVAYRPPEATAEVAALPAARAGHVTFGYSGRSERLNHHTFRVWGEILDRVPGARLILDFWVFADPPTQAHYRAMMARHGLDPDRVDMRRSADIFKGLGDIDILLDCFPHSGGTMLFDALWMGVPALTLKSRPPLGRIGTTLMTNLGMPDWVAESEADYIAKAVAFAGDLPALAAVRAGLRERMTASPLTDEAGFAKGVEAAYGRMWTRWLEGAA